MTEFETEEARAVRLERDALRRELEDLICETREGLVSPLCCNLCGQALGNGEVCSSSIHVGPDDDDFGPNSGDPVPASDIVAQRDEARSALAAMVDLYRHPDGGQVIVEAGASPADDALIAACKVLDEAP